jgi:hypothetical protein
MGKLQLLVMVILLTGSCSHIENPTIFTPAKTIPIPSPTQTAIRTLTPSPNLTATYKEEFAETVFAEASRAAATKTTRVDHLIATRREKLTNDALTPSPTPTPTPTPTLEIPLSRILDDFPLEVGLIRKYQVTYLYSVVGWTPQGDDGLLPPLEIWTGLVTERVIDQIDHPLGYPSFLISLEGSPQLTADGVVLEDQVTEYVIKDNSIYDVSRQMYLFHWPLELGASWDPWDNNNLTYKWKIDYTESVETEAGAFDNCYVLELVTRPDTTVKWLCPGVGVARIQAWSGGIPMEIYEWILVSISMPPE